MPLFPSYVERFGLLDGIESFDQIRSDPALEERFHAYMQWREGAQPPQVDVRDAAIPGPHGPVPVRIYSPLGDDTARPALVWMHGGAFMMGDLDMPEADRPSREVCARAGAVVVSVDYRLANGGVHYPIPLDDVVAAIRWVRAETAELGVDPDRIAVGGASAGATLATGAVLQLRDEDSWQPSVLLPVYGMFHPVLPKNAEIEALMTEVPDLLRFTPESTEWVTANYLGAPLETADGYAMPILADLAGLCPVLTFDGEYDDLRASAEVFRDALAAAGVPITQHIAPGMMHGFANLPAEIEPVGTVFQLMADAVRQPARQLEEK